MRWRRWLASGCSGSRWVAPVLRPAKRDRGEDLVDHHRLRHDPVMAILVGKLQARRAACAPLAGKSTLNRLEHGTIAPDRYRKISHDGAAIERLLVDLFLDAHRRPPKRIVLDLDATDDPLHGHQEGRFFHGYGACPPAAQRPTGGDCFCHLPLYVFCGRHLLAAKLRRSNIDASAGALAEIQRIISQLRERWPRVHVLLRADSGFAREALMGWCEANRVDYVFGLARNARLEAAIAVELTQAEAIGRQTTAAARVFKELRWATLDSWSRKRRVVAKAEWTHGGPNPRFIVTSLKAGAIDGRRLYEEIYCARGEMENRIKECQLDLGACPRAGQRPDPGADRTSAATMRANQLRLWFASIAYVLLCALRRIGLAHTQFAHATCATIRLRLLKIGALVRVSCRRVKVAMASAFPGQPEYALAYLRLVRAAF
jgi:hypothetical protein